MKCRTCKYYRFGSCWLGLNENPKCMWYKPDRRKLPKEKFHGEPLSFTPSQTE